MPRTGTGGDGPSTARPATVPGQSTGRPEHGDRPNGLGPRPGADRPGADRPSATPRPDADRPSRPDPRTADPRTADPRSADPRDTGPRPSTDRPTGAAPRPDTDRPDHGRPEDHGKGSEQPEPEDHGKPEDGKSETGKPEDHTGADQQHDRDPAQDADSRADQDGRPDADTPPHERPLSDSRPYDTPGGLARVEEHHQQELERRIPRNPDGTPQRHPDPYGDWPGAVNGDGHREPGRDNNCLDVALSSADTYSGNPTAAAARTDDGSPDGERGGRDRAERQLGAPFRDLGNGDRAFHRLEDTLRQSGHGSQAVIVTQDAHGRAHAWNVVNHNGKIVYLDNQTGARSDKPLHNGDHGVFAIPLDSDRRPIPSDHHGDGADHRSGAADRPDHTKDPSKDRDRDRDTGDARKNPGDPADRPGDSDRRPADPAGKHPDDMEVDHDPDHPDDESMADADHESDHDPDHDSEADRPRGSADYDDAQDREHTHYGMKGDNLQRDMRSTEDGAPHRDVRQITLDRAFAFLDGHVDNHNIANLLHETAQQNKNDPQGVGFTKKELSERLPGFADLNRNEQAAVVGVLGRLSPAVHTRYGVGASPERVADPYRYRDDVDRSHFSEEEQGKLKNDAGADDKSTRGMMARRKKNFWASPSAKTQENYQQGQTTPDAKYITGVRDHLILKRLEERHPGQDTYTPEQVKQVVKELDATLKPVGKGIHRPDFSGKNYAVVEVTRIRDENDMEVDGADHDPDADTRYVVDSSYGASRKDVTTEHSEPHIGRWLTRLNERDGTDDWQPLTLHTEREPCGKGQGHAHCSVYLTEPSMDGVNVSYATGYRKGEMEEGAEHDAETVQRMLEEDNQRYLNRIGDLWLKMAESGALNQPSTTAARPGRHLRRLDMNVHDAPGGVPDTAWLEQVFGADGVWRPTAEQLPESLTHEPTRAFLTEVGLPCAKVGRIGLDSLFLREEGLWAQDPDELYGVSRPKGDDAVSDICFKVMDHTDTAFMLDAGSGAVDLFKPDGWDAGLGYGGRYTSSLPLLVRVLGLAAQTVELVDEIGRDEAIEAFDARLDELGLLDAHPYLWTEVFEYIDEYFDEFPVD
ncbi:toxin glutamine deamidase domain-containing protein [Kitasatospora arboriphila]